MRVFSWWKCAIEPGFLALRVFTKSTKNRCKETYGGPCIFVAHLLILLVIQFTSSWLIPNDLLAQGSVFFPSPSSSSSTSCFEIFVKDSICLRTITATDSPADSGTTLTDNNYEYNKSIDEGRVSLPNSVKLLLLNLEGDTWDLSTSSLVYQSVSTNIFRSNVISTTSYVIIGSNYWQKYMA